MCMFLSIPKHLISHQNNHLKSVNLLLTVHLAFPVFKESQIRFFPSSTKTSLRSSTLLPTSCFSLKKKDRIMKKCKNVAASIERLQSYFKIIFQLLYQNYPSYFILKVAYHTARIRPQSTTCHSDFNCLPSQMFLQLHTGEHYNNAAHKRVVG